MGAEIWNKFIKDNGEAKSLNWTKKRMKLNVVDSYKNIKNNLKKGGNSEKIIVFYPIMVNYTEIGLRLHK